MLYGLLITEQGKTAISDYDGDSKVLSFFHAVILAKLDGEGYSNIGDLVSTIHDDYPFEMSASAISDACLMLEKQGLISCVREVSFNSKIVVSINQVKILTSLGQFINMNKTRLSSAEQSRILKQLQDRQRSFANIGNISLEIKLV